MHAHAAAHAQHPAHGAHHRNYVKIWAILTALLVVSVTGPMLGIRVITLITAFGIALVKAYLVAKNFMHLDIEKPIVKWLLSLALVIMVLLYTMVAPDVEKSKGQHWVKSQGFHYVSEAARGKAHEHGQEPKKENAHGSDHP